MTYRPYFFWALFPAIVFLCLCGQAEAQPADVTANLASSGQIRIDGDTPWIVMEKDFQDPKSDAWTKSAKVLAEFSGATYLQTLTEDRASEATPPSR